MKKRVHRYWKLVRASWLLLLRYRMLLLYPLLSTAAVSLVVGYVPLALMWARIAEENAMFSPSPKGIIGALVLYVVTCTTVHLFNAMLVADTVARLDGPYRWRLNGWRVAVSHFPAIFAYSLLSSSLVSIPIMVICWIARKVGIRSLPAPDAWSLGTFLGVPVIAVEGLGARAAMGRSEGLLRSMWGDRFVGGTGILIARIAVVVAAFVVGLGLLVLVAQFDYDPLSVAVAVLWLTTFLFLFVTGAAVSTIYCLAIYRHCVCRPIPGFDALNDIPGAVPSSTVPVEPAQPWTATG